jgi:predicted DNA-binding transcriptional regulator AlpA
MSKPDDPLTRAIGRILDDPTALARVIDERETARLIGISSATWNRLRAAGDLPPKTRLSANRVGYRLVDIVAWLDTRRETAA